MVKKLSDFRRKQAEKINAFEEKRAGEKAAPSLTISQKKLVDKLNINAKYKVISYRDIDLDNKQFQIRHIKTNLDDLKESIKTKGQQVPVFVKPSPDKQGTFQIISGFSRSEVLRELKKDIEVKDYGKIADDDALQLAIIENVQRNELQAADMISLIEELKIKHPDISIDDISSILGKRRAMVNYYIKISKFPDVVGMLTKQEITLRKAILLTELSDTARKKEIESTKEELKSRKESGPEGKAKQKSSLPAIVIDRKKKRGKIAGFSFTFEEKAAVLDKLKGFIEKIKEI